MRAQRMYVSVHPQDKLNVVDFQWKPQRDPSAAWEDNFLALQRFKEANGRENDPPRKYSTTREDGRKLNLGKWCDSQRQARKRKILSADQIQRLDAIGFAWSCNIVVDWQIYFDAVKRYKETHVRFVLSFCFFAFAHHPND